MSNEKVRTALEGYEQVFPEKLDELDRVYNRVEANGVTLEELGRTIYGYETIDRPTTEDGYVWFWGLHFKTGRGRTATIFPWAQDWDGQDRTGLDRSIAVHTRGKVDARDVDGLVEKLYHGFLEQGRRQKELQEASH